jgi:hypothetical protein
MFEQLLVLSNMSEKEGGEASFSIDMFDPSKPDQSLVPGEQHDVGLPVHQLQEIGASDLLPSSGFLSIDHLCNCDDDAQTKSVQLRTSPCCIEEFLAVKECFFVLTGQLKPKPTPIVGFLHSLTGCNFSMTISYDLRLRRLCVYCVGGKRITDRQMRNAIERRQKVFQGLLLSVFQQLQVLKPQLLLLFLLLLILAPLSLSAICFGL